MSASTASAGYTKTAIALHWVIAVLILGLLASGRYNESLSWATHAELKIDLIQWHKSFGMSVLALSVFRLLWRLGHRPPALPAHMKPLEKKAASATHIVFYILIIGLPLSGWALVSTTTSPTEIFGLFQLPYIPGFNTGENPAALGKVMRGTHEWVGKIMALLIFIHIGAALRHHFVLKDGILGRMIPVLRGTQNDP